jgi:hypothetical protein
LTTAKSLQPIYDTYVRLNTIEIPKLEAEMKTLQAKLSTGRKTMEQVIPHQSLT